MRTDINPSRMRGLAGRRVGLLPLLVMALAGHLFAADFSATLDRDTITLGENATLTLTFQGGQPSSISEPQVPGLQFVNQGSSQNVSFVNGQMSATISETFAVSASKPGDYTIPPFRVQINGQTFSSPPLKLTVARPGAPPPQAIASGAELAFLKLVAPKKEVYVGETFAIEVDLYVRDVVQNIGQFQFTSLPTDGFASGKWVQGEQRQMRIGNSVYRVVPLSLALTAIKTGTYPLGPITASVVVDVASQNRSGDPFIDQFFGGGSVQKQLVLATDSQQVKLLALPAQNRPANFNGAVGDYTMAVTAGPTNVAVGDPITVRVRISGRGALDGIELPKQSAWRNFKVYPATSKVQKSDLLGIQGTKTFEQIVAPQDSDLKELPPFSFSFFDPDQKTYRTLTSPALALAVHAGGRTVAPTFVAAGAASGGATRDIVPIKQHLGALAQVGPPLIRQTWFLAFQGVPLLAFIGALVWRKRSDALANNPRLRRRREVAQLVRAGLAQLRKNAAENQSDEFFATVFRLLQEQVGERLDLPASAITEAVVDDQLRPRGLAEGACESLHELFQSCNVARYAPVKTSRELAALIPKLEATLRQLEELS